MVGLTAWNNVELLAQQIDEFKPVIVSCAKPDALRASINQNVELGSITDDGRISLTDVAHAFAHE